MSITNRPLILAAVLSCAFCIMAYYYRDTALFTAVFCVIILCVAASIKTNIKITVSMFLITLISVSVLFQISRIIKLEKLDGETFDITAVATDEPVSMDGYKTVTVYAKCNGNAFSGKAKMFAFLDNDADIHAGDCFKAEITASSLEKSSYKKSNYALGIYSACNVKEVYPVVYRNSFYYNLHRFREKIKEILFSNVSYGSAVTLSALLLGDKDLFSNEFYNAVKVSGVSHVMVVSGMHLAIIMGAVNAVLKRTLLNRYVKFAVTVVILFFVSAVCGFTMSILRASLMYILSACAFIFRRDADSLSSLAAAVMIILFFSPFAILSIAFQLSVLATFAVITVAPFYSELIIKKSGVKIRLLKIAAEILIYSVCASLMTMPVAVYNFGFVSLVAPVTNLLISYAVTVAVTVAVFALALFYLPVISDILFFVSDIAVMYINFVIVFLSRLPFAAVSAGNVTVAVSVAVDLLLIVLILLKEEYKCR